MYHKHQVPALLPSYLLVITAHTTLTLFLATGIALFTVVAFSTTIRVDELSRTFIQRTKLRLPNERGLLFNFEWGQTM